MVDDGLIAHTLQDAKNILEMYPDHFHYVGALSPARPGVRLFQSVMEYYHFAPGTAMNDLYIFTLVKWEGILWCVGSIPQLQHPIAIEIAKTIGINLENNSKTYMVSNKGMTTFPISGPSVFFIVNQTGSSVYYNTESAEIDKEERKLLAQIYNGDKPDLSSFRKVMFPPKH